MSNPLSNLSPEESEILAKFWQMLLPQLQKPLSAYKESLEKSSGYSWGWSWKNSSNGDMDKENQVGEFKEWTDSLEVFWYFVGYDDPNTLLLRFLRARKWDTTNALDMLMKALLWRQEFKVQSLLLQGEECIDLEELTSRKGYIWQYDLENRPVAYCHASKHDKYNSDLEMAKKLTVLTVENGRLACAEGVETSMLVFDLTDFAMKNMDYDFVGFMIKVFEAYYPESLGLILIVNAPWIFNTCFSIIKSMMDPVVVGKIRMIQKDELAQYIPAENIPLDLGGSGQFEYIPKTKEEEEELKKIRDVANRDEDFKAYRTRVLEYMTAVKNGEVGDKKIVEESYKNIIKYIRSPTFYHRNGQVREPIFSILGEKGQWRSQTKGAKA